MRTFGSRTGRKIISVSAGIVMTGGLLLTVGNESGAVVAPKSLPTVTLTYGNTAQCWLPIWVGVFGGFFQKAGVNVVATPHSGASSLVVPLVATGQFDFGSVTTGAPLFNAPSQGYNIKLVFGTDEPHPGYLSAEWISVAEHLITKSGFNLQTLKKDIASGKVTIGTTNAEGSVGDIMTIEMLKAIGLTYSQVKTYEVNSAVTTQAQQISLFQAGSIDVGGLVGPADDVAQHEKIAREWLQYSNIVPWYQDCLLAANGQYVQQNPTVTVKVIKGLLMADQYIAKIESHSGPKWVGRLAQISAQVDDFPIGEIYLGRLPWVGGYGQIIASSIVNAQAINVAEGTVPHPLSNKQIISTLVDTAPLIAARKALRLTSAPPALVTGTFGGKESFPTLYPQG